MGNPHVLCLLSDFGLNNRFTGIMKGVACNTDPSLKIYDISHEVTPFNIVEAAYILGDTIPFWPEGTVFCAVIDPGVGTGRRAVGILTESGQYIICPDNGMLTIVQNELGIKAVRAIKGVGTVLPGVKKSQTFDGRDVFVYNAARLASGRLDFRDIGYLSKDPLVRLNLPQPVLENNAISGQLTYIEKPFGNICTNIRSRLIDDAGLKTGENYNVIITSGKKRIWERAIPFSSTFSDVDPGEFLMYIDSSQRLGIARNMAAANEKLMGETGNHIIIDIHNP